MAGAERGCAVSLGASQQAAFAHCLEYPLGGTRLVLAYTVATVPGGAPALLNGAFLAFNQSEGAWAGIAVPPKGTHEMIGAKSIIATLTPAGKHALRAACTALLWSTLCIYSDLSDTKGAGAHWRNCDTPATLQAAPAAARETENIPFATAVQAPV